jgi:hypothetical protein
MVCLLINLNDTLHQLQSMKISILPFDIFVFLLLYVFYLLTYYIQEESPERAASFGIFTLNIKCSIKYKKYIGRKSDTSFFSKFFHVVAFFIWHISQLK